MIFSKKTQLRVLPERGRGVSASSFIKEGELILVEELPFGSAPLFDKRTIVCGYCHQLSSAQQYEISCESCQAIHYCSEHCRETHASSHKKDACSIYKGALNSQPLNLHQKTLLILAFECLVKLRETDQYEEELKVHCHDMLPKALSGGSRAFIEQCHHSPLRSWNDEELDEALKLLNENSLMKVSKESLVNCLTRFQMNAFYACDDLFKPHTACVYVHASLFNHACAPNCVCVYEGTTIYIRALRDVPANEELTIAYVDLIRPYPERKHILSLDYGFECSCIACTNLTVKSPDEMRSIINSKLASVAESKISLRQFADVPEAFAVFSKIDFGLYSDLEGNLVIDDELPGIWSGNVNRALSAHVCAISAKLDSLNENSSPDLILETWKACEELKLVLHPCNKTLYGLRSEFFSQLLEVDQKEIAISVAEDLLITLAFVYRHVLYHPQFALLLNTYLDLRRECDMEVKKEWYNPVLRCYIATYGADHIFCQTVLKTLESM